MVSIIDGPDLDLTIFGLVDPISTSRDFRFYQLKDCNSVGCPRQLIECFFRLNSSRPPCGHTFTCIKQLLFHLDTHTKDKVFKCPYPGCNQSVTQKRNLKRHMKLHEANQRLAQEQFNHKASYPQNPVDQFQ